MHIFLVYIVSSACLVHLFSCFWYNLVTKKKCEFFIVVFLAGIIPRTNRKKHQFIYIFQYIFHVYKYHVLYLQVLKLLCACVFYSYARVRQRLWNWDHCTSSRCYKSEYGAFVECYWQGKTCFIVTLSTKNSAWTTQASSTNYLCCGTVPYMFHNC